MCKFRTDHLINRLILWLIDLICHKRPTVHKPEFAI